MHSFVEHFAEQFAVASTRRTRTERQPKLKNNIETHWWLNGKRVGVFAKRRVPVNCSATRLNISWIAVVLPTKHTAIFKPFGGMSHTPHFMLFGIHSMKYLRHVFTF